MNAVTKLSASTLCAVSLGLTGCGERSQQPSETVFNADPEPKSQNESPQSSAAIEAAGNPTDIPTEQNESMTADAEPIDMAVPAVNESVAERDRPSSRESTAQVAEESANEPGWNSDSSPAPFNEDAMAASSEILVPVEESSPVDASPPERSGTTYIVQPGDTLYTIAADIYGQPDMYAAIYEANQATIDDIDVLYVGQSLRLPTR